MWYFSKGEEFIMNIKDSLKTNSVGMSSLMGDRVKGKCPIVTEKLFLHFPNSTHSASCHHCYFTVNHCELIWEDIIWGAITLSHQHLASYQTLSILNLSNITSIC